MEINIINYCSYPAERLLKNRLEWLVESRNTLAPSQFGFRNGLSTTESLSIFTADIRRAFVNTVLYLILNEN